VTLTAFDGAAVAGEGDFGEAWHLPAAGLVLVTQQASQDTLYRELVADEPGLIRSGVHAVHRIGDAVAPRMTSEAVFDGHRLARELDGDNPSVPRAFRRERVRLE
jgi:dimethylamine/trimethylamine dehydrogenase